jgi:excisionase family DNA binding protein
MRPSRVSSPIRPAPEASDRRAVPAFGVANRGAVACGESQPVADPKLNSQHPPPDLPAWAAAVPSRHSGGQTRRVGVPDHDGVNICADDRALLDDQRRHSRRSSTTLLGQRLEPLITVAETAAILNVSERTVRRLIASGAISAVSIGRSLRVRPRDIGQLIAKGTVCTD